MTTIYAQLAKTPGGNYLVMPTHGVPNNTQCSVFRFALNDEQSKAVEATLEDLRKTCWDVAIRLSTSEKVNYQGNPKYIYANLMRDSLALIHLSVQMLVMDDLCQHRVHLVIPTLDGSKTWDLGSMESVMTAVDDPVSLDSPDIEHYPDAPEDPLPWEY